MYKILISISLIANLVVAKDILDLESDYSWEKLAPKQMLIDEALGSAIVNLRKLDQVNIIKIIDGVELVRNTPMESTDRSMQVFEEEMLDASSKSTIEKTLTLLDMLLSSGSSFLKNHSVKVDEKISRSLGEARTKLKKLFLPLLVVIGIKVFALIPVFLGGLTLASIKTFLFSKLALLASIILYYQRLSASTSSSVDHNPQYIPYDNGAGPGWQQYNNAQYSRRNRLVDNRKYVDVDAQNLAYAGYAPESRQ